MQKRMNSILGKPCMGFTMTDPEEAYAHMNYEVVEHYGDKYNGHYLYLWDEGYKLLGRCKACGGYILIQRSEMHGSEDDYYGDYFPVSGSEEAKGLNERYDGYQLEEEFPERYLMESNGSISWSLSHEDRMSIRE